MAPTSHPFENPYLALVFCVFRFSSTVTFDARCRHHGVSFSSHSCSHLVLNFSALLPYLKRKGFPAAHAQWIPCPSSASQFALSQPPPFQAFCCPVQSLVVAHPLLKPCPVLRLKYFDLNGESVALKFLLSCHPW